MKKRFNIAGTCIPQKHYMADTSEKLSRMIRLIEQESYFTINRARQYGKTTTLMLLWSRLKEKYVVINISFEGMGMDAFGSEDAFVRRFCGRVEKNLRLSGYSEAKQNIWKCTAGKENLKLKLRPDEERKYNSPWNIAVDFPIDMSLSVPEISSMIREYEEEQEFAIDAEDVACEIRRYTSGYPFLVSLICLWMDERVSGELSLKDCWTPRGVRAAAREILKGTNPLFDDMIKNLENNPKFRSFVEGILFHGNQIPYKVSNKEINLGVTFGIIGEKEGLCKISNIMFETYIYDHFIADQVIGKQVLSTSRTQFVDENGDLEMDAILEKFQDLMKAEYRREYIVELKLWSGPKKHEEGLRQLLNYMESRGQKKGWLLTFCFLKNREKRIEEYTRTENCLGDKSIYSVVV
nr:hypothetical protein [uncultured Schaedlerella sp.]